MPPKRKPTPETRIAQTYKKMRGMVHAVCSEAGIEMKPHEPDQLLQDHLHDVLTEYAARELRKAAGLDGPGAEEPEDQDE